MIKLNDDQQKEVAALEFVEDGMIIGLGSGSTAEKFIHLLGKKFQKGGFENVKVLSSSKKSEAIAKKYHLEILRPESVEKVDLNIDGTDETCISTGDSVKGGGNALHREKMVALKSQKNIFIAQASKAVESLGGFGLPIEIGKFDTDATIKRIKECLFGFKNLKVNLKKDGENFLETDNRNYMLHVDFGGEILKNPQKIYQDLRLIEGVFSVGLFLNILDKLIIGKADGSVDEFDFLRK